HFRVLREGNCSLVQNASLIELWNALPNAEQARCHIPGFAIQLLRGPHPVFTAALCWKCNNISLAGSVATLSWRKFDASSQSAQRLLVLCEEVVSNGG